MYDRPHPFFFKQWGGTRKKEAGRILDGRFHDEFPVIATGLAPSREGRRKLLDAFLSCTTP